MGFGACGLGLRFFHHAGLLPHGSDQAAVYLCSWYQSTMAQYHDMVLNDKPTDAWLANEECTLIHQVMVNWFGGEGTPRKATQGKANRDGFVLQAGFRVSDSRFGVWGLGFLVPGSGFRGSRFGSRVSRFGFRISGSRFRVPDSGFRVAIFGFPFWGSGFRVHTLMRSTCTCMSESLCFLRCRSQISSNCGVSSFRNSGFGS